MNPPPPRPAKILHFDIHGRIVGSSRADGRLTVPVRLLSAFFGIVLIATGVGLLALMVQVFSQASKWSSGLGLLLLLVVGVGIASYGLDLFGRGLRGRPWSRRFWAALDARLLRRYGYLFLGLVLLGLVLFAVLNVFWEKGADRFEGLLLLASIALHLFCHELGHLSAAGAVGYHAQWLAVGPVELRVTGGRLRVTRSRSWRTLFGGAAAWVPIEPTRAKDLLVIAAGPLANLALAAAALDAWGWPGGPSSVFAVFLQTFIGVGFAIGLFNLLPLPRTTDGLALDGRELLDLLRHR